MNVKKCSSCNVEQPLYSFYYNRSKPDGLSNWCKVCVLDYAKKKRIPEIIADVPKEDDLGEEHLEKWWNGCKKYYQSKTNHMETLTTNEVELLKKAHSRLHNQLQNLIEDFDKYRLTMSTQVEDLKMKIRELNPKEDEKELPKRLVHNTEYQAEISEVLYAEGVNWNGSDYTNWEVKVKGKDETYYAFCPSSNVVEVGTKVRFTYNHPVQLKKLRVIK